MSDRLLEQLKSIKTATELEDLEEKNRDAIISGSVELRINFDTRWKELKGSYYFQPVTSTPPPVAVRPETMHPKMVKYRVPKVARQILWRKITEPRKAGSNQYMVDFYDVKAVLDTGLTQTIGWKLDKGQIAEFCGKDVSEQIVKAKKDETDGAVKVNKEVSCIGYWMVVFHPKSHENDTADVLLNANGLALQVQREKPVIMPGPHLNAADDGRWPRYHEEPGQPRKVVAWIQTYAYTPWREASESEFWEQKREGDKLQREEMARKEAA